MKQVDMDAESESHDSECASEGEASSESGDEHDDSGCESESDAEVTEDELRAYLSAPGAATALRSMLARIEKECPDLLHA